MRHHNANRKFGREKKVRTGFVRSLLRAIINVEAMETTEARAKEIRPMIEKMVTRAKPTRWLTAVSFRQILAIQK